MKSNKQKQDNAKNSKEQTQMIKPYDLQNKDHQADYDDSTDLK
ncbi:hypothetical protein V7654_06220 [Bacillus sp. JJ1609]